MSLLKVNEINYLPAQIKTQGDNILINDKYLLKNINDNLVSDSLISKDCFIGFDTNNISIDEISDVETIKFKVYINSIDLYSDKKVYYAQYKSKNNEIYKVSFYSNKDIDIKLYEEIYLYVKLNDLSLYSTNFERLTVNKKIYKPILSLPLKKIKNNYYFISNDKLFSKNKYFIVKDILNISNEKMMLNLVNNKNEFYSIEVDRDDNLYVEMCIFIKYKK